MALIVFLRGVNVGGHRTFRPSIVARELSDYDVVNVGAAGTFVVRKPGSRAKFRTALLRKLPFSTQVVLCDGRDLLRSSASSCSSPFSFLVFFHPGQNFVQPVVVCLKGFSQHCEPLVHRFNTRFCETTRALRTLHS